MVPFYRETGSITGRRPVPADDDHPAQQKLIFNWWWHHGGPYRRPLCHRNRQRGNFAGTQKIFAGDKREQA